MFDENNENTVIVDNIFIEKEDIAIGKVFRNASIVQAPNVLKTIRLYNIGDEEVGLTVKCNSQVEVIDLTKMFGSGNEPSTVEEFEAMFPSDYYPYSEGELMSMGVNNVVYTDTSSNQTSHQIPQEILDLEGYGWSSGTAYNCVDFENKKFIKNVERVDLSTMAFVYTLYGDNDEFYGFRAPLPEGIETNANSFSKTNNLLCSKYPDTPWKDAYKGLDKTIS